MRLVQGIPDDYNPDNGADEAQPKPVTPIITTPAASKRVQVMAGERELKAGLLSKETSFRLLVNGPVGAKEIDRLISSLQLDKDILSDNDDEAE